MSKKSRKQMRHRAAQEEKARRWRAAEEACPLSRSQLDSLLDFLAERITEEGHDHSFAFTAAWCAGQGTDPEPLLRFLQAHRIGHDYSVATEADPHCLFGPTAERRARMPLSQDELEELIQWLDDKCAEHGCDSTHRFAREWLQARDLPVATTEFALLALGGGCDCEVVLNVEAEAIYV
jgi:hypothetical protein